MIVGQNSVFQKTLMLANLEPGVVNRISRVFVSAGGKGANAARAALLLGQKPILLSYAGGHFGKRYGEFLTKDKIENVCITIHNETRGCTTVIEESARVTELAEPAPQVTEREREEFLEVFNREIEEAHFLMIGGTAMKGESDFCYRYYIEKAHLCGVLVLLDSYKLHSRRALQASPEILKINTFELEELSHSEFGRFGSQIESFFEIKDRFGLKWLIVTKGSTGAAGFDGEEIFSAQPPSIKLVNSIGSGDAFCAGLLASISHQLADAQLPAAAGEDVLKTCSITEALISGIAAGTANCLTIKPGHLDVSAYHELETQVSLTTIT